MKQNLLRKSFRHDAVSRHEGAARRSHNQILSAGFNAEVAKVFAKAAKPLAFAFLCENLRGLCGKRASQSATMLGDGAAESWFRADVKLTARCRTMWVLALAAALVLGLGGCARHQEMRQRLVDSQLFWYRTPLPAGSRMTLLSVEEDSETRLTSIQEARVCYQRLAGYAPAYQAGIGSAAEKGQSDAFCSTLWSNACASTESPEAMRWRKNGRNYKVPPLVRVTIGGTEGVFALDTGCPVTVLNADFARRLKPEEASTPTNFHFVFKVTDIMGKTSVATQCLSIARLQTGNCVFSNFLGQVMDVDRRNLPADGILGASVLHHAPVTWNLRTGWVVFGKLTDLDRAYSVLFRWCEAAKIAFPVRLGRRTQWVGLDTGSANDGQVLALTVKDCVPWGESAKWEGRSRMGLCSEELNQTISCAFTTKLRVGRLPIPGLVELKHKGGNLAGWGLLCRMEKFAIDPVKRRLYFWPSTEPPPPVAVVH